MTSLSTTALFVVFLKDYMAKEHGFPEKKDPRPPRDNVPLQCVCDPHPSTLPLKPDMSYLSMKEADGIIHGDDDALEYKGRRGSLTEKPYVFPFSISLL